jgi:hypothetical protein
MLEVQTNLNKTDRQAETPLWASSKRLPVGSTLRKFGMSKEKWLPVVGYEESYEVSDLGQVRYIGYKHKPRIKLQQEETMRGGYKRKTVSIWKYGKEKRCKVHRLVLTAFIGSCPADMECCHNDGNSSNNCLTNLRWDTKRNNALDRVRFGNTNGLVKKGEIRHKKVTPQMVKEIREIGRTQTLRLIAKRYPIRESQISNILLGYCWKNI